MENRSRHSVRRNAARSEEDIAYPAAKHCVRCGVTKPSSEFSKAKRERCGLKANCKACSSEQRKNWYRRNRDAAIRKSAEYQRLHPDKVREWAKNTYCRDPELTRSKARARHAAKSGIVAAANRERYSADPEYRALKLKQCAESYRRRKEKVGAYAKQWAANNPDKVRASAHRSLAKKHKTAGTCTADEWRAIKEYFGYCCAYCLRPETGTLRLSIDHLIPLTRGGTSDPDNLAPACRPCNSAKNDRTVLEFVMGLSPTRAFKKAATF